MSETKEFQGKNLDEAIDSACKHYDLKRDKLEIEIVSGGSSGIFGLVGVKPAIVRAKPRGSFKSLVHEAEAPKPAPRAEKPAPKPREAAEPAPERVERKAEPRAEEAPAKAPAQQASQSATPSEGGGEPAAEGEARPRRSERGRRGGRGRGRGGEARAEGSTETSTEARTETKPQGERQPQGRGERQDRGGRRERPRNDSSRGDSSRREQPRRTEPQAGGFGEEEEGGAPLGIAHLDQALLEQVAFEVTTRLLAPLSADAKVAVTLQSDRVLVRIDDPENSGLLIGREGQTLASIQYLVNRLVSKRMDASVRVQIDTGDYRENQDEKLRQIARHLADKAMASGRTQSTRPMSSYHRRVVHLTLQEDEFVFTRSKGEGSMKRVLIVPKREQQGGEPVEETAMDSQE